MNAYLEVKASIYIDRKNENRKKALHIKMLNALNACRQNKEKCDFPNEYANLNNDLILVKQRSYNFPSKVIAFDDMQE